MSEGHDHGSGANRRQLTFALALTGSFLIAELIGAYVINSLALLSDAAHMLTDTAALAIAIVAIRLGERKADDKRTYGYRRFEILAAAFNAVLLFLVAGYILWEGIGRFFNPEPVGSVGMFIVATIGLVINLISMRILSSGKDKSLNVKGAYLEVWADMLGSIGVLLAAAVIWLTGWRWVDPVIAILIGIWVLPRTWILLKETTQVMLEGVPKGIDLSAVRKAVTGVPGVNSVHDLHVWAITSEENVATLHVVIEQGRDGEVVRRAVAAILEQKCHLSHATIQTEQEACDPGETFHPCTAARWQ